MNEIYGKTIMQERDKRMNIKVMHVLASNAYSGAENVVMTLINGTRDSVDALYVSPVGPIKGYLEDNNIRYVLVKRLCVGAVRRVISQFQPDIIQAHDFMAGVICSMTGTRVPIINHIHNNPVWIKKYCAKSLVYLLSCPSYCKILTVSNSVMNEYVFGRRLKNKTEIIRNPVDINKIRGLSGSGKYSYDVAFLGRLSRQKNPFLFIDIIKELKKVIRDVRVVMIGDGDLRNSVEKKIDSLGLSKNIRLTGFLKNPYEVLNSAKVLLMPSEWEGYGLAAVESLALGKPVVCSNVGGLPSIVNDKCGKVCNNYEEYVPAILNILDKDKYRTYSSCAYKRAEEIGNLNEFINNMLRIYNEVKIFHIR